MVTAIFPLSEGNKADLCWSKKGIHTQIHYITDLIKSNGFLFN